MNNLASVSPGFLAAIVDMSKVDKPVQRVSLGQFRFCDCLRVSVVYVSCADKVSS